MTYLNMIYLAIVYILFRPFSEKLGLDSVNTYLLKAVKSSKTYVHCCQHEPASFAKFIITLVMLHGRFFSIFSVQCFFYLNYVSAAQKSVFHLLPSTNEHVMRMFFFFRKSLFNKPVRSCVDLS